MEPNNECQECGHERDVHPQIPGTNVFGRKVCSRCVRERVQRRILVACGEFKSEAVR